MKFASLVFLLVPFVANAADLCVEDNISKCKDLGYTESSCPYGGVACQLKNKGINATAIDNEINAMLPYLGSNQYTDINITAFRFALERDSGTSFPRYYHEKVRVSLEF